MDFTVIATDRPACLQRLEQKGAKFIPSEGWINLGSSLHTGMAETLKFAELME